MKVCIGLCNRMRVIASAYQLIRPQGGKLVVKRTSNGELNCPAKALFSLPRGIRVMDVTGGDNSNPPPRRKPGGGFRLSKNHVIARQCAHCRGNPPNFQTF